MHAGAQAEALACGTADAPASDTEAAASVKMIAEALAEATAKAVTTSVSACKTVGDDASGVHAPPLACSLLGIVKESQTCIT